MDRKNATVFTVLFFIRFVTDYGKDNSYFNVCPCVDTSPHIKMNRKNAIVLFFIRFVTDYGKDNLQFSIKMNNRHLAYVLV